MEEAQLGRYLTRAYDFFAKRGHQRNQDKIKQLAHKLTTGEYAIAFAGHFSAGKSRMINSLLGEKLLPSSPIPTSANLVRVHKGQEEYARVFFKNAKPRKYLAPYDYELVRSFCKNGDEIAQLELSRQQLDLPEKVEIMDTPGIDSADDAHRLATEDALHLADIIIYVMDYNHVQAEMNLSFTRDLTQAGKKVYLVINQIDKHVAQELSFADFKAGVEQAFGSWGVKPAGYFYTSLKYPDIPHNQYEELQATIKDHLSHRQELLLASIEASVKKLLQEYQLECAANEETKLQEAKELLGEISLEQQEKIIAEYDVLAKEQEFLALNWQENLNQSVEQILTNAYLMPTSTRDLAKEYLESCQSSFKVGFWQRAQKTQAERERRKQEFLSDAREKAKTQIQWHLKTCLTDCLRSYKLDTVANIEFVDKLEIIPPEELLEEAMRSGAQLTQDGTYVMNYTSNFAEGTRQVARNKVQEFKNLIEEAVVQYCQQRQETLLQQIEGLQKYYLAKKDMVEAEQKEIALQRAMAQLAEGEQQQTVSQSLQQELFQQEEIEEEIVPGNQTLSAESQKITEKESELTTVEESKATESEAELVAAKDKVVLANTEPLQGREAFAFWSHKLLQASELLQEIPPVSQIAQELQDRAQRMAGKGFLVTLFGAFSAGKSSFANALLGEQLLPVSPNPTTAAINKIMPVDGEHPHGTVRIKLKDADMLVADLNRALQSFDMVASNLAEAYSMSQKALSEDARDKQREKAFLSAFLKGYDLAEKHLGEVLSKTLEEFPLYAAQEDKSCFVDWIEVYYDCKFTRLGITLVDTPGADSINARHTNMSFNFIRQSDAVLFVTYYNHAFSRADREFLIQLGRVKDSFALDKIFFVVNAIDLAESPEEAQGVVDYVGSALKKYGVRKPQLYPLSSQEMLQEKLAGVTKSYAFEQEFFKFVGNELTSIAITAAQREYEKAILRLQKLLELGKEGLAQKEIRKEQLNNYQREIASLFSQLHPQEQQNALQQEIRELLYYVKQRVFLRYTDFYREAFNPATLQGRNNSKQQLAQALAQLKESLGFDLAQELRATTLRLENFIVEQILKLQKDFNAKLRLLDLELPINEKKYSYESNLEFATAFQQSNLQEFQGALALYKNPKEFFEQGVSKVMAEEMEHIFDNWAQTYLQQEQDKIDRALQQGLDSLYQRARNRLETGLQEKLTADREALEGDLPIATMEEICKKLINLGS